MSLTTSLMVGRLEGAHEVIDGLEVAVVAGLLGLLAGIDVVDDGLEVDEGSFLLDEDQEREEAEQEHCYGLPIGVVINLINIKIIYENLS
jgi:hypothetical protein